MVTLEITKEDAMNLPLTQPTGNAAFPAGAARFAFASGARPLDGYTIKRGVGHGGFGEVYYAVSDGGKEVALKLVRRNLDIEIRGVTQCLNLKHPNLVSLFDIRQDDQEETWVVMEYVSGQSLQEVLAANPKGLPTPQVLHWMQGMCAGVAYLHDHGIVHRDLKPGNVFMEDGIVKIGDYGLSKFISCSRRSGHTGSVGTVHYMAPEVANGRYGKEVDIYALGIVLYEMITGHVPFDGESLGEVLMKHLTAQPDLSMIAEPYRTAIARALAKDPEQRVRSVAELAALLPQAAGMAASPQGVSAATQLFNFGKPAAAASPAAASPNAEDPAFAAAAAANKFGGPPEIPLPGRAGANRDAPPFAEAARPSGNQEPLWQLIRATGLDIRRWWDRADLANWQRLAIVLALILLLIPVIGLGIGVWATVAVMYCVYWIIWNIAFKKPAAMSANPPHARAPPQSGGVPQGPPRGPARSIYQRWRGGPSSPLPPLTARQRMAELVGSMFIAGVVSLLMALVMFLIRGGIHGGSMGLNLNQYAWLAISAMIGTWGVLIPAKLWQGKHEDVILRRFVMLAIGLLVGAAAWAVQSELLVQLPYEMNRHLPPPIAGSHDAWRPDFYDVYGAPTYAFLTYFGFLFFVLRWWRQADPLRHARLRLWPVAGTVFWAAVANMFWPLPQPWGLMLAATISISVQMASVWIPLKERRSA